LYLSVGIPVNSLTKTLDVGVGQGSSQGSLMSTARGRERERAQAASLMSTARRLPTASSPTGDASQAPLSQVPCCTLLSRPAHHTRAHHANSHSSNNPRVVKPYQLAQFADCLPEIGICRSAFAKGQRVFLAFALHEIGNAGPR
jgi:hypothetical protein